MTRIKLTRALTLSLAIFALAGLCAALAIAQTTTQVERGEVLSVSGNQVLIKMDTGEVREFTARPGATGMVDGKQITVADLKPGMKLQRTITTTSTARTVESVRTATGTVWNAAPPYIIFTMPDGKNKRVRVPEGTTFVVNGQKATMFDLRKGMKVTATVVTRAPETVVTRQTSVTGSGAPPPPPRPVIAEIPSTIEAPMVIAEPEPVQTAQAAPPAEPAAPAQELPKTGTPMPLIGTLGLAMSLAGIGLRLRRRS